MMRQNVNRARAHQQKRQGYVNNAQLSAKAVEEYASPAPEARDLLKKAFDALGLSMRGYHKVLKIARTIADLDSCEIIQVPHVREAIMYRSLDKTL